jgi:phenylpropionate dioxygenase-like ring-hydroxylating dioxygenase large terminal subunit
MMAKKTTDKFPPEDVKDDFVPKEVYFDREFFELEKERLWPYVWQIACREEEIPNVGDFVTYDICDDSIIVVRSKPNEIKAFHNVCPHRGNRLTEGCDHAKQFLCTFHGWRFGLDGRNISVIDRKDWGDLLSDEDVALKSVQVGTWGGFVFINMDKDCQPLDEFLVPVKELTSKHEFEKLRYAWYRSTIMPANWKTVSEAFNEFYHVQQTHSQMMVYTNDYSASKPMGRHGWISYAVESGFPLGRSPRLPPKEVPIRELILEYAEQMKNDLDAMYSDRSYQAAQRIRTETTNETPPDEVIAKLFQFTFEEAQKAGSGWPEGLTPEYLAESGFDWHVFPNTIFLHPSIDAVLWYRFRPYNDGPEMCIFDIWSLERFAPGTEPKLEREFYNDWRECKWPLIYTQDFANITRVQKGMHSRVFQGGRTSPIQERAIPNFHRSLRIFLRDPHEEDGKI